MTKHANTLLLVACIFAVAFSTSHAFNSSPTPMLATVQQDQKWEYLTAYIGLSKFDERGDSIMAFDNKLNQWVVLMKGKAFLEGGLNIFGNNGYELVLTLEGYHPQEKFLPEKTTILYYIFKRPKK